MYACKREGVHVIIICMHVAYVCMYNVLCMNVYMHASTTTGRYLTLPINENAVYNIAITH